MIIPLPSDHYYVGCQSSSSIVYICNECELSIASVKFFSPKQHYLTRDLNSVVFLYSFLPLLPEDGFCLVTRKAFGCLWDITQTSCFFPCPQTSVNPTCLCLRSIPFSFLSHLHLYSHR